MKYIKFYENINWNDWDEEEVDTIINVGDFVKCKYPSYHRSDGYSGEKDSKYIKIDNKGYMHEWSKVIRIGINNLNGDNIFKILGNWPWYVSDEWEKKT